jgi:hypothetical protein
MEKHPKTKIFFDRTLGKDRHPEGIEKNKTKPTQIIYGTLLIDRKDQTFVFFDKNDNRSRSG